MRDNVTHAGNVPPGDVLVVVPELGRQVPYRFANDLEVVEHGVEPHRIAEHLFTAEPPGVLDDPPAALLDVVEKSGVLRDMNGIPLDLWPCSLFETSLGDEIYPGPENVLEMAAQPQKPEE